MVQSFRQGTELQTIEICNSDPTIAPGLPGTPNLLLLRTDNNSLYYFKGPLDTDWALICCPSDLVFQHEMIVASIVGRNNYPIPIGDYVWSDISQSTLDVNKGAGFVSVPFGVGYNYFLRSAPGTPPTVNDAAIGFSFIGVVPAGWTFRFRWIETVIPTMPISIAKVRFPINYAIVWNSNSPNAPNGVTVPEFPGVQCEFWRQTGKPGGKRGSSVILHRDGRRYIPFFRGALGLFNFTISDFSPANARQRQRFKVCYYNPLTGARSRLSSNTIVVCSLASDAVNGRSPVRSSRSVWIED